MSSPTIKERTRWLARARTILRKTEDLQGEMLDALGNDHVWTDYGDNVMCEAESLVGILASGKQR